MQPKDVYCFQIHSASLCLFIGDLRLLMLRDINEQCLLMLYLFCCWSMSLLLCMFGWCGYYDKSTFLLMNKATSISVTMYLTTYFKIAVLQSINKSYLFCNCEWSLFTWIQDKSTRWCYGSWISKICQIFEKSKSLKPGWVWWCAHLIPALEVEASRSLSWRPALIA